jgi:hypothetical protein
MTVVVNIFTKFARFRKISVKISYAEKCQQAGFVSENRSGTEGQTDVHGIHMRFHFFLNCKDRLINYEYERYTK